MSIFSSVLRFSGRNVRISRQISSCLSVSNQVLNLSKPAISAHVSNEKFMLTHGFSKGFSTHIERQPHSGDFFLRQARWHFPIPLHNIHCINCLYSCLIEKAVHTHTCLLTPTQKMQYSLILSSSLLKGT